MALLQAKFYISFLLILSCYVQGTDGQSCPKSCRCVFGFVSCYNFTEVNMDHMPLDTYTIVMHAGSVKSFPPGFLQPLTSLELLEIRSCKIEVILPGTFAGASSLQQLEISDCNIGSIQRDAFSDMGALTKLYLAESDIGTIDTGAFTGLHDVVDFSMWSNEIGTIMPGAFSGLSDFHTLSFYMNNVTVIAPDAFRRVSGFSKIDIYLNRFVNIGSAGSIVGLLQATGEFNLYSNVFPCDCQIARMINDTSFARFLGSNRCLRKRNDGDVIVPLNRLNQSECEDRVDITTTSTPKTTTTTTVPSSHSKNSQTTRTTAVSQPSSLKTSTTKTVVTSHATSSQGRSTGTYVTSTGDDVTRTESPRSLTTSGAVENNGDSEEQSGENPGNSASSQTAIVAVSLTIIPVILAVGLVVQFIYYRNKRRTKNQLHQEEEESRDWPWSTSVATRMAPTSFRY